MGRRHHTRLLNEAGSRGIAVRPYCVVGETRIDCPRDLERHPLGMPIRDLVGQEPFVYAWDEGTGTFVLTRARAIRCTRRQAEVWEVTYTWRGPGVRQGTLLATPDHPVLGVDGRWTRVRDLNPGDRLRALYRCYERMGSRKKPYAWVCPRGVSTGRSSYVQEHRFIMAQLAGPLAAGEHVDHRDNRSLNNVPDNL